MIFVCALLASALAEPSWFYADEPLVAHLDTREKLNFFKQQPHTLIEFFAPWCPHCQRFRKAFVLVAQTLHQFNPPVCLCPEDYKNTLTCRCLLVQLTARVMMNYVVMKSRVFLQFSCKFFLVLILQKNS